MADLPVRLIATDIDGTLLNDKGVISERSLRAIHAARERGVVVAIATGRFPENAYLLAEDYGLRLPIIGSNGACIVDEQLNVLSERTMNQDSARQVLDALVSLGADYFIFGERAICTSSPTVVHHSELRQGDRIRTMGFRYYHGTEEAYQFLENKIYKFFVCNNVPLFVSRAALLSVPGIELTQSSPRNIEVMPAGVDKGLGIRDFARVLDIPLNQVMTLGDESNDIPMLRTAGWGVAMGNGSDEAKKAARFITDSNTQDGFAKAIERFAL